MASRPNLHNKLKELLGSENVYYQPPQSTQMRYDAIVYSLSGIENTFAGDSVYSQAKAYKVTVITEKPDAEVVDKISKLPSCSFVSYFTSDRLNHYVFTLYY